MELNKGAVGIFVILCVIGGATGYYLATSGSPQPVVGAAPLTAAPDSAAEPAAQQLAPVAAAQAPAPAAPAIVEKPVVRRAAVPQRPARPAVTRERRWRESIPRARFRDRLRIPAQCSLEHNAGDANSSVSAGVHRSRSPSRWPNLRLRNSWSWLCRLNRS